jgi:hypothetical protein
MDTSMPKETDPALDMKAWIRTDLASAMKQRRSVEVKVLRVLMALIDNAEAPPVHAGEHSALGHDFSSGLAEVERLSLSRAQLHSLVQADVNERERAAEELARLGEAARADALQEEARVAGRYLVNPQDREG